MSAPPVAPQDVASTPPADEGGGRLLTAPAHVAWLVATLAVSMTYAVIRYNIFKGVEWIHVPLYITNKAFALTAVVLIACSYAVGKAIRLHPEDKERRIALVKYLGLMGFSLAAMHGVMSMTMLSPVYYEKFYVETGKLSLLGELSVLFGVLSLWCLTIPAITSLPFMDDHLGRARWRRMQQMGYAALALNCGHLVAMGATGWFDVSTWPGSLPPITLLGFIVSAWALLVKMVHTAKA